MWVEPEVLRSGGDVARSAGQRANDGAGQLAQAALPSGMFGDFEAAHAFHAKLSAGHTAHVDAMRAQHKTLTGVGDKAQESAGWFEKTEQQNTAAVTTASDG